MGIFGKFFRTKSNESVEQIIREKLRAAGPHTLDGTKEILAVAILYQGGVASPPPKERLAQMLVQQYQGPGWIPPALAVMPGTPIAMRQMVHGKEITDGAGLDTAGSNAALAAMLAGELESAGGCSAIAFSGDSPALGQTFFAVVGR